MVLSLTPPHSDHSQGACMYRQCRPFLLWCRWHRKKKKKAFSVNTKSKHTNSGDPPSPHPSFLLLGTCCPRKIKAFSLMWHFHAVMHAHLRQLLKCKWKLFCVVLHPAFVLTSYLCWLLELLPLGFPKALMYSNLLLVINLSQCFSILLVKISD